VDDAYTVTVLLPLFTQSAQSSGDGQTLYVMASLPAKRPERLCQMFISSPLPFCLVRLRCITPSETKVAQPGLDIL